VETLQEEEDLFARAMSGLGEDDGNAADEDSGRAAKKRPRESAGSEEYDAEGRVKERRVGGSGESGARGGSKSSSINGGARPELENKFRIPSPPRCGTVRCLSIGLEAFGWNG
jgi:hypothetical protein